MIVLALSATGCGGSSDSVPSNGGAGSTTPASRGTTPPPASETAPPSQPQQAAPAAPPRPRIVQQPIPYPASRKNEMAAYAKRHYGVSTSRLRPRMIVLHFTASGAGSEAGVHALFASDEPSRGELPGVCAHFIVDQDGTIYQQVALGVMCRHTIGLNHLALGIEMVQDAGPSSHWADQRILHRPAQRRSVIALVRWLLARYHIAKRNVIGHAMANDSPLFRDREGWVNDHTDWLPTDVAQLRRLL